MSRHHRFPWLALSVFALLTSIAVFASSHVRIVRLSSVEGQVQMDRGNAEGLERAILNTPIVEGTRLVTGSDGLAEVEFENESALRITDNSEVKFSQLLMNDAGAKINQFEVVKGTVYLDAASKGDDVYRVKVGDTSLVAHRDTVMRISATPEQLKVAVFKGDVQLEGGSQPVSIKKKETLTVDATDTAKYSVTNGTETVRYDAWNKEREDYKKTYAENAGYGGPNRGFGLQDLNYYGDFFYASGYGYAWQPYGFAGSMLNWDPYSNGAWMFYPGMGYSWISAYPWGWLPFHYGSWAFINGAGWAWLPGGGYNGTWYAGNFLAVPKITRAPAGWTAAAPPAQLGTSNAPRTVFVGKVATTNALTVPGGRIPPTFGSVVAGRSATTASGFVKPNPQAHTGVSTTALGGAHQGHVFAAPAVHAVSLHEIGGGPSARPGGFPGSSAGVGPSVGASHASSATSSAAHK
jgi:hypothetical protein